MVIGPKLGELIKKNTPTKMILDEGKEVVYSFVSLESNEGKLEVIYHPYLHVEKLSFTAQPEYPVVKVLVGETVVSHCLIVERNDPAREVISDEMIELA